MQAIWKTDVSRAYQVDFEMNRSYQLVYQDASCRTRLVSTFDRLTSQENVGFKSRYISSFFDDFQDLKHRNEMLSGNIDP